MILLILIPGKSELLDSALRLAEILADVSIASALSIQLRFQFSDAGFHLDHGFTSSFQCIDLSFIGTGSSILALGLKKFLSFSRFIATSCSQRSSSARRAASTIALAA